MRPLGRGLDQLSADARALRSAQARAGDLWRDIVFAAFDNRALDPLEVEQRRFLTAATEHDAELARALGELT